MSDSIMTKRPTSPFMENWLYREIPVLDHGHLVLCDYMGDEAAIIESARISYGAGTRSVSNDVGLLRYLMRHRHCYHPNMQVLTIQGWKNWEDCDTKETFLVPNPDTRKLTKERLVIKKFDFNGDIICYENDRMSFSVTPNHTMWFKHKGRDIFEKFFAINMPKWGHFDPLSGYNYADQLEAIDKYFELIGFYLGDGSQASTNRISFHLLKLRKIEYLRSLLLELSIPFKETQSSTHAGGIVFNVETPHELFDKWIIVENRAKEKEFLLENIDMLNKSQIRGLWWGLVNSDGSYKSDRPQIQFGSSSSKLLNLFEVLSTLIGIDAHYTNGGNILTVSAYIGDRTSLESRSQYYSNIKYKGKVFCATTSTGFLMVRGKKTDFAFVCGNTTPFESCEIKVKMKLPIFVARQLIRHRTASVNEYSARYSELLDEFYIPDADNLQPQSTTNKQGRSGELTDEQKHLVQAFIEYESRRSFNTYQILLGKKRTGDNKTDPIDLSDNMRDAGLKTLGGTLLYDPEYIGIARELARIGLTLNTYTQWIWKIDLHNLLHFIGLRSEAHAQYEIRAYSDKLRELAQGWLPNVMQAFWDYQMDAVNLSGPEWTVIKQVLLGKLAPHQLLTKLGGNGISERERKELLDKIAQP